jgi:pimeloyl-ACP methyl ester carboxylesterase
MRRLNREAGSEPSKLWLDAGGLRVHCLVAGEESSPVVLLHGGGIDSARFSYKHAVGPLAHSRRVFAPDWPGYGESESPDVEHTSGFYAGLLGPILDALKLERASLVGISMGGGAALAFSLRSPERVEKLVLVDSYGLGSEIPWGRLGYLLVRAPFVNDLTWALLRRSRRMVRWSLYNAVHDRRVVTDEMVEEARRALARPGAGRAFQSWQKNEVGWKGLRTDFADRLGELRVPTLIVHGEHDRFVPVAWARRAHERIPDSELRVLRDCGHMPPRERPEEFNEVVGRFLAGRTE